MILLWRPDTDPKVWTQAEVTNYLALCELGLDVTDCTPAPFSLPKLVVNVETSVEPADFFFGGLVFVVSADLRSVLESFKVKVEFLELKLVFKGKSYKKRKFYFANILDVVECFDYTKSKYKATDRGAIDVKKLVLDESKAEGHHLFRVGPLPSQNPNPKAIRTVIDCASEELAVRIIESGLTGVVFTKPKDRQVYPPPAWKPPK